MTRVTQSDIARAAGVHNTTVSLALRNSPAIPEATRKRIQAVAEELGYSPDPALQALVAYRHGRMTNRRQETIAYVTNWPTKWGWQDEPAQARIHAGALRKATECGYHLEHFWLGDPDVGPRRLNSMLFHRGISAVILASQRPTGDSLTEIDWSRLSAIAIGASPSLLPLHRVTDDCAAAMRLTMRQMREAGYQRVGLLLPCWQDELTDHAWSTSFLVEQSRIPADLRVPALTFGTPEMNDTAIRLPIFQDWVRRHRPDAIIGFTPRARSPLTAMGLDAPRTIGWATLGLDRAEEDEAGVSENSEHVGELATELLVGHIQRNLRGLPSVATTTLVEGTWKHGTSLPIHRGVAQSQWKSTPARVSYAEASLVETTEATP